MDFPTVFRGPIALVRRECSKIITKLKKGATIAEATEGPTCSLHEIEGLIVLDGPSGFLAKGDHAQLYALLRMVQDQCWDGGRLSRDRFDQYFFQLLALPWGILALQGTVSHGWFINAPRSILIPSLMASLAVWDRFPEGPRYTSSGLPQGKQLWETIPKTLYVLANLGVSANLVHAHPPDQHPAALIPHLPADVQAELAGWEQAVVSG